jgi:hypothetical protein
MSDIDDQLKEKLEFWGITNYKVSNETKSELLLSLSMPDIERVYIDKESNNLCIDFKEWK